MRKQTTWKEQRLCTNRSRNGRKDLATLLLSNKADPNAKDLKGNTPLHYAVRTGAKGHGRIIVGQ